MRTLAMLIAAALLSATACGAAAPAAAPTASAAAPAPAAAPAAPAAAPNAPPAGPPAATVAAAAPAVADYLGVVETFAKTLLDKGLDAYGPQKTPLWCSVIDARSLTVPETGVKAPVGVREGDRALGGSNLYQDNVTLRVFGVLSAVTGNPRYQQAARDYAKAYLELAQDPKTGLLGWGEHTCYNVFQDKVVQPRHELLEWTPPWAELWAADADRTARAIAGLKYHFFRDDTKDFLFNRHADWGGGNFQKSGQPWIKHSGLYCYSFMFLYAKTKDEAWLNRARGIGSLYWNHRNPETNLTEGCLGDPRETSRHASISNTSMLSYWLLKAAYLNPAEKEIHDRAMIMLKAIDQRSWNAEKNAYWGSIKTDGTPVSEAGNPWYMAYSGSGLFHFGRIAAFVARTEKDPQMLEAARRVARLVRQSPLPPRYTPESVGYALNLSLDLYDLTGEADYLADARAYANFGVQKFRVNGLIVREPGNQYYESKVGAGDLLAGLLRLHLRLSKVADPEACDWSF